MNLSSICVNICQRTLGVVALCSNEGIVNSLVSLFYLNDYTLYGFLHKALGFNLLSNNCFFYLNALQLAY